MAAAADVLLTGGLIVVLQRSRTGFEKTDNLIDILILYAINTGMLIGLFNVLSLIMVDFPHSFFLLHYQLVQLNMYFNARRPLCLGTSYTSGSISLQQSCMQTAF
ncbi:hypothetical protein BD413DRAFT_583345 [Trametes elegans]|nr:hypothetical protein BD413DRAFT_583345 [Trametes elegans]